MDKEIKKIVIMLGAVGVLFLLTLFLFVYKTSIPTRIERTQEPTPSQPQSTTTTPSSTPTSPGTPPEADPHTALDDCIALKMDDARGQEYEEGSLLVSFLGAVSYDTAIATIEALDLRADTSAEARANFNTYRWLSVYVERGEEFKWQCILDSSEGIRKANLNLTFNLRQ